MESDMQNSPFTISRISSRLGRIVAMTEWAERMQIPSSKEPGTFLRGADGTRILGVESKSWDPELFADFNVIAQTASQAIESAGVGVADIDSGADNAPSAAQCAARRC